MRIVANLEKIITLTASQYQTLVDGNSITSGGKTYNFDANALYVVPEETIALSDIDGTADLQAIENLTGTSGFLKKTGTNTWSLDTNTYLTNVPLAANGTRGGVQIGYTTDATNHNYAVQLSNEKMYVNVPWTDNDTKVTSAANHYTPSTVDGKDKTASASGATAAWSIDVVQGITINTDGKGHITGLNVASGKIPSNPNTDTKLTVAEVTSGTTYYPIVGAGTTAATRQYDTTGFVYKGTNGTTSAVGSAQLTLGNSTVSGKANNKQGKLILYGSTAYAHTISGAPTAARTLTLPDKSGTIAVTDDIPDISGKIDTAGTGLSKSGTTLNHSNSITKQDTQAVYPIKIDAQGHISAYGTAVTLGTAAAKGVTDNSSNADVTSSDTNLITARTLYYQLAKKGYTTNTGTVTSITLKAGTGISLDTTGAITTSGERTITNTGVLSVAGNTGTITADTLRTSLGLSNAMHFLGVTTTNISTGTPNTTATVSISGSNVTAAAGDVVLYGSQEYVWGNSKWNLLGDESSYALKATTLSGYGITDAKIASGVITLGSNTITPLTAASNLDATKLTGTIPASCYTDTNTTYSLSGALSSHKFTSTLTAGGSGTGTSTSEFTLAAGTGISLEDNTSTKTITIKNTVSNTDVSVTNTAVTAATTYYLTGSTSSSTATGGLSKHASVKAYVSADNTTGGLARLDLGNATATSSTGGKEGVIRLYGTTAYYVGLKAGDPSANQTITLPNKTGTVALTSDIPDVSGKIDTAGTGLSKSGTTLNHSNSVNEQTTQAIYPIKIDAQGHISSYGSAVTPLTASSTLDATKLSGTIPSGCYTNSRDAGYGKITPANNTSTTSALTGNTTAVVASNYNENLKLTAANKWVVLAGTNSDTAGSDELKIAHLVPSSISNAGPTSNQTGSRGSTFNIPKITLDEAGHVTGISSITVSLPSSDNTDEKVKQNSSTTSAAYKLLMTTTASPTSGNTYETNYATTLSYNPSTKVLTNGTITLTSASSTSANGNAYDVLSLGNSTNVTSTSAHSEGKINIYSAATNSHIIVGKSTTTDYTHTLPNQTGLLVTLNSAAPSANIGSTTKPVYVSSAGVVTEANTYAGGTAVTLNGTSAAGSTASFYAPTTAGTSGYYLKSNGSGAPTWTSFPTIPSITLNGSSTTSPSFYAPTSAGTSGQYLKSNGSGAPTWANMPAAVTVTASGSGNVITGMSVTNNAITYTLGTVSTVSAQIVRW